MNQLQLTLQSSGGCDGHLGWLVDGRLLRQKMQENASLQVELSKWFGENATKINHLKDLKQQTSCKLSCWNHLLGRELFLRSFLDASSSSGR